MTHSLGPSFVAGRRPVRHSSRTCASFLPHTPASCLVVRTRTSSVASGGPASAPRRVSSLSRSTTRCRAVRNSSASAARGSPCASARLSLSSPRLGRRRVGLMSRRSFGGGARRARGAHGARGAHRDRRHGGRAAHRGRRRHGRRRVQRLRRRTSRRPEISGTPGGEISGEGRVDSRFLPATFAGDFTLLSSLKSPGRLMSQRPGRPGRPVY